MKKIWIIPCLVAICLLLVVAGCNRYGGAEGLARRVRAEIAQHRPHPDFVPTPVAIVPASFAAGLRQDATKFAGHFDSTDPALAAPNATDITIEAPSAPSPVPTEPSIATALPVPTDTPIPAYQPANAAITLTGFSHMWQTWNNCGPATLAMNLSYFGSSADQAEVAAVLRPDPDDKNVNLEELASFAHLQGYHARVIANGDSDELRLLLSNGLPVLIETWLVPEPNDGMGHYRLLTGYDDASQRWIAYDSYHRDYLVNPNGDYQGVHLPYAETDELWKVFNRRYLLVYTDEQAPVVEGILGEAMDDTVMWRQALAHALADVEQHPNDPFAWFNLGTDLVALGRYEEAATAYDQARQIGLPWRMLWYQFGPFQAYYETGRYQELIALADATIRTVSNIEEIYYWKGRTLAAQGDIAAARQAFQRAATLNLNYVEATDALAAVSAP